MRRVSGGKGTKEVKVKLSAIDNDLDNTSKKLKPGIKSGDRDEVCRDTIKSYGFGEYFHNRTGYSIGIGYPPGWGEGHIMDLKPYDEREVVEGMTFHLVPLLI